MEATEKTVSEEDEHAKTDHLTEHQRKVFEALRQMNVHQYCPPASQIAQRTSLDLESTKIILLELCRLGIVVWRIDASENDTYRLARPEEFIRKERLAAKNGRPLEAKPVKSYEAIAAAALKSKVKQLYEDGLTYDEISEQLNIPRGKVSTIIYRLVAKGEMKARGKGKRGEASAAEMTDERSVSPNQDRSSTGTVSPKVQPTVQRKILSCSKCDFTTKSYAGLNIHFGQKHRTTAEIREKYKLQELKAKNKKHAPVPSPKEALIVTVVLTGNEALTAAVALALADVINAERFKDADKISGKILRAIVKQIPQHDVEEGP